MSTILVIEDSSMNMRLFNDLLSAAGYAVLQATNGMAGLSMAREHRPSLIIMDIQLPDLSGIEVTRRLKQDTDLKGIPIFAVTAFAMKGDEAKIREAGCDGYMSKPIDIRRFLKSVQQLLG